MAQEEKEIYSIIFKVALKLSKNRDYVRFAIEMLKAINETAKGDVDTEIYSFCWDTLKEYADITNKKESEERWQEVVDKCDGYGKGKSKFERRMISCLMNELEERGKRNGGLYDKGDE